MAESKEIVGWCLQFNENVYESTNPDDIALRAHRRVFATREEAVARRDAIERNYGTRGDVIRIVRRARPTPTAIRNEMLTISKLLAMINKRIKELVEWETTEANDRQWDLALEAQTRTLEAQWLRDQIIALGEKL